MRRFVIGDIHGCYTALESLIASIKLRDDEVLVTLGDYCNRGPNTCAVLDRLVLVNSHGNLRPPGGIACFRQGAVRWLGNRYVFASNG